MMRTFYIPYCDDTETSAWPVLRADGQTLTFHSRRDAMAYALNECRVAVRSGALPVIISIEGHDGRWRSFDSRLMPVLDDEVTTTH